MFLACNGPGGTLPEGEAELVNDLQLCRAMPGWTLDYVREMDAVEKAQVMTVLDAMNRASAFQAQQASKQSKRGRG